MTAGEKPRELSPKTIWEKRQEAIQYGFSLGSEKPGYDLIGRRGWSACIDRQTEELVVLRAKFVERNGRPWVNTIYPRGRNCQEYMYLGWRL